MKKKNTLIGIIAAVVFLVIINIVIYNSLVSKQTDVEEESSNIDTQLQRRMDLIPNLVETVKSYTEHETEVFASVTESREKLMNANSMEEKYEANQEMTTALNKLIAIAEAYPELTSSTVYIGLMDELAGTENRISVARNNYNEAVTTYNKSIRKFPSNLFAGLFGFKKAEFFKAGEGTEKVPEVKLN